MYVSVCMCVLLLLHVCMQVCGGVCDKWLSFQGLHVAAVNHSEALPVSSREDEVIIISTDTKKSLINVYKSVELRYSSLQEHFYLFTHIHVRLK